MNVFNEILFFFLGAVVSGSVAFVLVWRTPAKPELKRAEPNSIITRLNATLHHWQLNEELVNWARTSSEFAQIVSIIESLQPTGFPIRGQNVSEIQCAVELGRHEGYADCYRVVLSLREFPPVPPKEIEADYSQDEEESES